MHSYNNSHFRVSQENIGLIIALLVLVSSACIVLVKRLVFSPALDITLAEDYGLYYFLNHSFHFRFEDMKDQLRKRMFRKRKIRRLKFIITDAISIEVNTYALVRPTNPGLYCALQLGSTVYFHLVIELLFFCLLVSGTITWLDSVTNLPLKVLSNVV